MELILLENILNLGNIGDKVKVRSGYGRNFLLKQGKTLRFSNTVLSKQSKFTIDFLEFSPTVCSIE